MLLRQHPPSQKIVSPLPPPPPTELAFTEAVAKDPELLPIAVTRLQQSKLAEIAAAPRHGDDLLRHNVHPYHKAQGATTRHPTTLQGLDRLLQGGFETGEVVEVAGGRQSGRSAIVMYTLLYHLLHHANRQAAFLHTSAQFDASRCRFILHSLVEAGRADGVTFDAEQGEQLTTDELAVKVLGRLSVIRPLSAEQALEGISAELAKKDQHLSMVVIDSAETLLGGEPLSAASAEGHATLVAFSRCMKELTRLHQLTIFLVNSATTTTSSTAGIPISSLPVREHTKPLLGPSFTYLSDLTLWTTKADSIWGSDGRGKFIVEVARNRRGESRGWACFDLSVGITLRPVE